MTGKEALIQVSKSCSALALEFGNLKIGKTDNEALQTLKEIVVKYDKYKKAFEILKEFTDLPPLEEFVYCKEENYYYVEIDEYDDNLETYKTIIYTLGKKEYELLKEVLGDENT